MGVRGVVEGAVGGGRSPERFNGRMRAERLIESPFFDLDHARETIAR